MPDLLHLLPSKPAWHDRNPLRVAKISFVQNIGGHALVTRWTYTVPSLRMAFLGGVNIGVWVRALGGAGSKEAFSSLCRDGVASGFEMGRVEIFDGAAYSKDTIALSGGNVLQAGNVLAAGDYADPTTTANYDHLISAFFSEFDQL